jgi:uncharacterized membrane protein (UPF0127 family)
VTNVSKDTCLGNKIGLADTPLRRATGLLGTSKLDADSGLLIFPTQAVHSFGMNYAIDLVFVDRNARVVGLRRALRPNRLSRLYWRAQFVIELPTGTIDRTRTEVGDVIEWCDADLVSSSVPD